MPVFFPNKSNLLACNTIFERPFCQHSINTARKVSDTVTICLFFKHHQVTLPVRFSPAFLSAPALLFPFLSSFFFSPSLASRGAFASARPNS